MKPDRVVIGTQSSARRGHGGALRPFVRTGKPILHMDIASAELTKYAANAMLATRISFMNEIANICTRVGANVDMVRKGIGSDDAHRLALPVRGRRLRGLVLPQGRQGGICKTAEEHDYEFQHPQGRRSGERGRRSGLFDMVTEHFKGDANGAALRVWGLAFKPTPTTCARRRRRRDRGAARARARRVAACDPEAIEGARKRHLGDKIEYIETPDGRPARRGCAAPDHGVERVSGGRISRSM
jgi:UDPglucose 6-dehydrogenase